MTDPDRAPDPDSDSADAQNAEAAPAQPAAAEEAPPPADGTDADAPESTEPAPAPPETDAAEEPGTPIGPSGRPVQVLAYRGRTVRWGPLVGIGLVLGLVVGLIAVGTSGDLNAAGWVVIFAAFVGALGGGLLGLVLDAFARRNRPRR